MQKEIIKSLEKSLGYAKSVIEELKTICSNASTGEELGRINYKIDNWGAVVKYIEFVLTRDKGECYGIKCY